jgi:hypothetical protein
MPYEGSCQCGAVKFSVEGEPPTEAIAFNTRPETRRRLRPADSRTNPEVKINFG